MIHERPMPVNRVLIATLLVASSLAGCGGSGVDASTSTAPATTAATRTASEYVAACARLQSTIVSISQLVTGTVDEITNSLHPKELARRAAEGERNVLFAARVLRSIAAPPTLVPARDRLVVGLREFARDLGRAHASVAHGDLAAAARQLADPAVLRKLASSTRTIARACGG
jgi:hypothetical protein